MILGLGSEKDAAWDELKAEFVPVTEGK